MAGNKKNGRRKRRDATTVRDHVPGLFREALVYVNFRGARSATAWRQPDFRLSTMRMYEYVRLIVQRRPREPRGPGDRYSKDPELVHAKYHA
ncbi:hypothetical protein CGRA01v4_04280 [Colletotrichum graminicola]|uniref:Uncharacterized protein n=1 Tax=Colletotrichum graminicola (strain M1.001 / M2 / FGSC 10212) TaxID=645133 RepID=E3Q949_COLGM|nr:uncharacterized protein GLRG_01723 [Colletotrichum graminicola M1.001]EFQ27228.1 hypothetical protein GLRG_01723 [Colletotrichum graminicola M1.001]WDK12999.1 hypothetical protein CGRA01v4_04280 [Colletotrichum graminicola]